jgi:hypothetical protein
VILAPSVWFGQTIRFDPPSTGAPACHQFYVLFP